MTAICISMQSRAGKVLFLRAYILFNLLQHCIGVLKKRSRQNGLRVNWD